MLWKRLVDGLRLHGRVRANDPLNAQQRQRRQWLPGKLASHGFRLHTWPSIERETAYGDRAGIVNGRPTRRSDLMMETVNPPGASYRSTCSRGRCSIPAASLT